MVYNLASEAQPNWPTGTPARLLVMGLRVRTRDLRFHYFVGVSPSPPLTVSTVELAQKV